MVAKLILRTGAVEERDFVIGDDLALVRIGTARTNEIVIRANGVSRNHARVVRRDDGLWVEDADSRNGTFVNGLRVKSERLRHLDVLTLGRQIDLVLLQRETANVAEPSAKVLSASLEALDGPVAGTTVDIPVGELIIGRLATCNVTVNHESIGKTHARIVRTASQVAIEDLDSRNGTFVNDKRVAFAPLKNDDCVLLANVARFRVHVRADFGAGVPFEPAEPSQSVEYDQTWRTRIEERTELLWSPSELREIERGDARVIERMEQTVDSDRSARRSEPRKAPVAPRVPDVSIPQPPPTQYADTASEPPTPPRSETSATTGAVAVQSVEILGGQDGTVRLGPGPGPYTIGRGPSAHVRLPDDDRLVSRQHALLTLSAGGLSIDPKGPSGTFVNGKRMDGVVVLQDGDEVRCGQTTLTVQFLPRQTSSAQR